MYHIRQEGRTLALGKDSKLSAKIRFFRAKNSVDFSGEIHLYCNFMITFVAANAVGRAALAQEHFLFTFLTNYYTTRKEWVKY